MSWNNVTSNSSSAILDSCLPLPPGVVIWPPPLSSYFKTCLFSLPPYEIHYTIVVSLRPLSHPLTLPPSYHNTHFIHSFWNLLFLSFPIRSTMPDYCFPPSPGWPFDPSFPFRPWMGRQRHGPNYWLDVHVSAVGFNWRETTLLHHRNQIVLQFQRSWLVLSYGEVDTHKRKRKNIGRSQWVPLRKKHTKGRSFFSFHSDGRSLKVIKAGNKMAHQSLFLAKGNKCERTQEVGFGWRGVIILPWCLEGVGVVSKEIKKKTLQHYTKRNNALLSLESSANPDHRVHTSTQDLKCKLRQYCCNFPCYCLFDRLFPQPVLPSLTFFVLFVTKIIQIELLADYSDCLRPHSNVTHASLQASVRTRRQQGKWRRAEPSGKQWQAPEEEMGASRPLK